ncbi:MAG TPA: enoyl-CoA hydratase-related protein [Frankiaceae bacterium]|nr:enoyl-CoA hydratase-related protein [Frankiaceae bacterium]
MEYVRIEVEDRVATVRLDRPPMNALSRALQDELREAALEVGSREDVRAVVVYGGEKVFAAGADIKEMSTLTAGDMAANGTRLQDAFTELARIPKPVVAAITGYALGGGLELAMTADFRVAGDNVRVGQPEILLGIIPGAGGTQRLTRLVGPAKAKDLIFTGRHVRAAEALEIGLIDKVVAPDDVYAESVALARRFVDGPAVALRAAKQAVDDGLNMSLADGLRLESALFAGLFGTEDQSIGMASFLENGPGKAGFVGR